MKSREKIRVLIVESSLPVIRRFEKLLNLMHNVEIAGTAEDSAHATEMLRDRKPDVALVEINLPDMNGTHYTENIRRDFPLTQVIVISQNKFSDTVLEAMRAGASDFLVHDVEFEELSRAVIRAAEAAFAERKRRFPKLALEASGDEPEEVSSRRSTGKIVTVYSPKGGTGVTTIAINLAIALNDQAATVALVDGNIQFGDVAILLNELTRFSIMDLVPRMNELDPEIFENVMTLHRATGIHVLAAPPRPELAENVTGGDFARILEHLRGIFDYTVINTSSFITDPCLAALDAGDVVVLVTNQEIAAIRDIRSFLGLWETIPLDKNRLLLVLNQFQADHGLLPEKISERLKMAIPVVIPEDEVVFRSTNLGVPFLMDHKGIPVEGAIRSLAGQVVELAKDARPEARYRVFSKDLEY